jgi:hypothetical protein
MKTKPKTKTKTNQSPKQSQSTGRKVWRDASGRFASPVKFDGLRYRDKSGRVRKFATTAKRPSAINPKKPSKARQPPVKVKVPNKPSKPVKPHPKKPGKAIPAKTKAKKPTKAKPKKKKVKSVKKPPKAYISQMFGKSRREKIRPITEEDRERITEAEESIAETKRQTRRVGLPFGPSEISPLGYEYYELIAAMEKMSPHDVYTLFMSP